MSAVPKRGNLQDKVEFAGHASNVVTENWIPPIQKHTREGVVQFVTIRVRIFASDSENDFNAKLNGSELYPEDVCKVIADRQGLSESARKSFALWVIGRDIELQLRPRQDVFALMEHWHRWVEKYTHFPEAKNAAHPICRQ